MASLTEAIRQTVLRMVLSLQTALPGRVISYDATAQTADVQPLLKWADFLPGRTRSLFDLPVLPDVLVCMPRAGQLGVHLPLDAGDLVLLVFCSRSIASWRGQASAGTITDPGRVFTPTPLEAAVALPLMTHDSAPLGSSLAGGDVIRIGSGSGLFERVAKAEATLDRLQAIVSGYNTHIHPAGTPNTGPPTVLLSTPVASVEADHVEVS